MAFSSLRGLFPHGPLGVSWLRPFPPCPIYLSECPPSSPPAWHFPSGRGIPHSPPTAPSGVPFTRIITYVVSPLPFHTLSWGAFWPFPPFLRFSAFCRWSVTFVLFPSWRGTYLSSFLRHRNLWPLEWHCSLPSWLSINPTPPLAGFLSQCSPFSWLISRNSPPLM